MIGFPADSADAMEQAHSTESPTPLPTLPTNTHATIGDRHTGFNHKLVSLLNLLLKKAKTGTFWLFTLVLLLLAVSNLIIFYFIASNTFLKIQNIPLLLLGSAVFLSALFFLIKLTKNIKIGTLRFILCSWVAIVGAFFLYLLRFFNLNSFDFALAYSKSDAVEQYSQVITHGQYSIPNIGEVYFAINPQQLFLAEWSNLFKFMFGVGNYLPFKIVQLACVIVTYYLITKIAEVLFENEKIARITIFALFACFVPIMYANYIYNDIPSLMLNFLSIYMAIKFVKTASKKYLVFLCIVGAVSYWVRANSMIFVIGIFLLLLFYAIKSERKKLFALSAVIFIVSTFAINQVSIIYNKVVYNFDDKNSKPTASYIAMGMINYDNYIKIHSDANPTAKYPAKALPGYWNGYWAAISEHKCGNSVSLSDWRECVSKESLEDIKSQIKRNLKSPQNAAIFYAKKFSDTWNTPDFHAGSYTSAGETNVKKENMPQLTRSLLGISSDGKIRIENDSPFLFEFLIKGVSNTYNFFIYAMSLFGVFMLRKKITAVQMLPAVIFMGGFFFHWLLWETNAKYVLVYFMLLIPYAAFGVFTLFSKVQGKLKA
jgi:hypothetical protein